MGHEIQWNLTKFLDIYTQKAISLRGRTPSWVLDRVGSLGCSELIIQRSQLQLRVLHSEISKQSIQQSSQVLLQVLRLL